VLRFWLSSPLWLLPQVLAMCTELLQSPKTRTHPLSPLFLKVRAQQPHALSVLTPCPAVAVAVAGRVQGAARRRRVEFWLLLLLLAGTLLVLYSCAGGSQAFW
jgi:hypothetical protein